MIEFDDSQSLALALDLGRHARVLGAPGTGKTTVLVEAHVRALNAEGWHEEDILSLAPNRLGAAALKLQIEARAHVAMGGTAARTAASLAFSILARGAALAGDPAPRLLTGTVQDEAIAELLADGFELGSIEPGGVGTGGSVTEGTGAVMPFPPEVFVSPAFRGELRELWRVSDDYARDRQDLASEVVTAAALGGAEAHSQAPDPDLAARWAAGLTIVDAVAQRLAQSRPGELTSSGMLREATDLVHAEGGVREGARLRVPRLILIDDAQEFGEGELALIAACAAQGSSVWVFGDPDVATAAFQGEASDLVVHPERELVRRAGAAAERGGEQQVVLTIAHRQGPMLRGFTRDLTGRVGARGSGAQRAAAPRVETVKAPDPRVESPSAEASTTEASSAEGPSGDVASAGISNADAPNTMDLGSRAQRDDLLRFTVAPSVTEQLGIVAHQLRARRLGLDGEVPLEWEEMAVLCRTRAEAVRTSRALALHQVPTALAAGGIVLRDHQLVRDLVRLLRHALGLARIDAPGVLEIVGGPVGRLDPVARRRLRRELLLSERRSAAEEERATVPIEERVYEAFTVPGAIPVVDSSGGRALRKVGMIAAAGEKVVKAGGTARETLWAIWEKTGLAAKLQNEALDGSPARADEANRALDAVVGLFFALQRHEEQDSAQPVADLLTDLMENTLPEDSLARQADRQVVTVTTPQGSIGREFTFVAVLGLQDGSWPNLRARGMLLGAAALERWLRGGDASAPSRRDTIHDELRLLAFSCARASGELLVVSVSDEEQHPSAFFRFGQEYFCEGLPSSRLTLRGVTAQMRRNLVKAPDNLQALRTLGALAREGVAGAAPDDWYGGREPSTARPLTDLAADPEAVVPVSPSQLERAEQCPLDWAVSALGGGKSSVQANIGTLVHHAFETVNEPDHERLFAAVLEEWAKLPFDAEWESERSQRTASAMVSGLASYLREFANSDRELLGQEARFRVPIERALLRGVADRLEGRRLADGRLEVTVLDLKTGRTPPTANETAEHAQLQAYQLGVALGAFALNDDASGDAGSEAGNADGSTADAESTADAGSTAEAGSNAEVAGAAGTEEAAGTAETAGAAPEANVLEHAVVGGARLLYVHPDAAKAKEFVERGQAPITDEMKEAFMARVSAVAKVMAAGEFVARVEHHCSDPYRPGECQIHIVPAVSHA